MTSLPNTLLTLLFPRRCPVCDKPVKPWNALACRDCISSISYINPPFCMKCGKHIGESEKEYCLDCSSHAHLYNRGRALFSYQGISASLARFKYRGRQEYAAYYALCLWRELGSFIVSCQADALIPVPLHKDRRQKRGYNQAEVLARELSTLTGIPVCSNLIARARKTVPMKDLSAVERQNNLKKAFKILRNDVKLDTIIIIDDIYTTGSTIDAMSRELRNTGIKRIYFLTLAIGQGI